MIRLLPLLVIVRVTGTTIGVEPPVIVIEPGYIPAGRPDEFMVTVRLAGVVPVAGVAYSQLTDVATVKLVGVVLFNGMVWGFGAAPPSVCEKESAEGAPVMATRPALVTVKVTGTEATVEPAVTVIEA